ncbi:MAG TPA: hypothetical protein DD381_09740 [Lentisphaeria bacterium]|nr:MAG: hypothetical protein A2X47_09690 [Lentisphaerae bacterium GWF2_38_69]HBM16606.1 hypothetical protein [Lentisphaeria bacterium]
MSEYVDINHLRDSSIRSLINSCPLSNDNPECCQLHHFRKLPHELKIAVFNKFSDKDCLDICKRHQICLFQRVIESQIYGKKIKTTA